MEDKGRTLVVVSISSDATQPVVLDANLGIKIEWFLGVGIGLLAVGIPLTAEAIALIHGGPLEGASVDVPMN